MFLDMERDETTLNVARNIRAIMQAKKLSALALAKQANINPTGVYDILSGKSRSPKIETLGKIASALETPISRLFEDDAKAHHKEEITELFFLLSIEDRDRLMVIARALLAAQKSHDVT